LEANIFVRLGIGQLLERRRRRVHWASILIRNRDSVGLSVAGRSMAEDLMPLSRESIMGRHYPSRLGSADLRWEYTAWEDKSRVLQFLIERSRRRCCHQARMGRPACDR
jgi:hypothetical protein